MKLQKNPFVIAAAATVLLLVIPTMLSAEALPRPLQERIELKTHGGKLQGVLPGCPPCAGLSVVVNAHNYSQAVDLYDANTGGKIGQIVESRHAHLTCAESGQVPDVDTCFQQGLDVLPDTTLDLTIALKDDDTGVDAFIKFHATGPTQVTRFGDGDKKATTSMELNNTVLYGETDSGIPVTVRIGRSFGLEPTMGTAKRMKKAPFPDYVAMVVEANAQFTIGWPDEVSLEVVPPDEDSTSEEVAVTVLSTEAFDALEQVDREHLTFGPTGTEVALSTCVGNDVNNDGIRDLRCQLGTHDTGFGDDQGVVHDAVVRGFTAEGEPFEGRASFSYGTRVAAADK
ncbi:MAG: hypothetical protein GY719_43395 [bacterium]|nr:hypothetical protein [bacterium]